MFQKFLLSEKVGKVKVMEGVTQLSVEKLLSHSTEAIRKGTLWCFRNFLVSTKFLDNREGGKVVHAFPSKNCCLTVAKNLYCNLSLCSEIFWYRKILCLRERERGGGEGVLGFLSIICCLTVRINSLGGTFCFS